MLSGTISVIMYSDYNADFGTELCIVVTDFSRPRQPLQAVAVLSQPLLKTDSDYIQQWQYTHFTVIRPCLLSENSRNIKRETRILFFTNRLYQAKWNKLSHCSCWKWTPLVLKSKSCTKFFPRSVGVTWTAWSKDVVWILTDKCVFKTRWRWILTSLSVFLEP